MRINKRTKVAISGVLILCFIAVALPAFAQEGSVVEKMGKKLGRGLVNIVTGWIELPKNRNRARTLREHFYHNATASYIILRAAPRSTYSRTLTIPRANRPELFSLRPD